MCNWSVQVLWQIFEKISAFYQGILRCGFYMIWWDLSSLLVLMGLKYLILIYCATTNSVFWKNVLSILTASSKVFHELLQILHLRKTILIRAASWQNQQNDCAPSEDSDQPGHPPSLIRVFAVRMKKARVFSYPLSVQWRLWSDWADGQADLSLHWVHSHFVGFT